MFAHDILIVIALGRKINWNEFTGYAHSRQSRYWYETAEDEENEL